MGHGPTLRAVSSETAGIRQASFLDAHVSCLVSFRKRNSEKKNRKEKEMIILYYIYNTDYIPHIRVFIIIIIIYTVYYIGLYLIIIMVFYDILYFLIMCVSIIER